MFVNNYLSMTYTYNSFFTLSLLEIGLDFVIFIISKYVLFFLYFGVACEYVAPFYLYLKIALYI